MAQPHDGTMTSAEFVRSCARQGDLTGITAGLAPEFAQANLAVVPRDLAYDFLLFCLRNPKPCPLLDVTDAGSPHPPYAAPKADLRTDLPPYRVYRDGELVEEPTSIERYWAEDLVEFLLGCSFTFEQGLLDAGIRVRHLACGSNVAMYRTNVPCRPAGIFRGPLVVSMRPIPAPLVAAAVQISGRYPAVHGAPVHIGAPEALGIRDLGRPDWGDAMPLLDGEVSVFWACGVTAQAVAMSAHLPLIITHAPGCMLVTDIPLATLSTA